jgi:hypothetical protein
MSTTKEMQEITCDACGDPCNVVTIDNGIGFYEYWGATGFDSQICDVSDCCEADFTDPRERDDEDDEPYVLAPGDNPPF